MTRRTSTVVSVDPSGEIILRDTKAVYVLMPGEVLNMLALAPDLWRRAVIRGKDYRRREQNTARERRYAADRERRAEREV